MARKGISPLVAAVLLIAFTMAVASLFAPWANQLIQGVQQGTSEDAGRITAASEMSLDIERTRFDKSNEQLKVTVRNSGEKIENDTNISIGVISEEPSSRQFSTNLTEQEIKTFSIPVERPGSIRKVEASLTKYPVSTENSPDISISKSTIKYDVDGDGSAETADYYGEGTESDPYEVGTLMELQTIDKNSTMRSSHYTLVSDLDASATSSWNSGKGFDPISPFSGTINGKNHTIKNLDISRPGEANIGLLGSLTGEVTAVYLREVVIEGGDETGAIAADNSGKIKNCGVIDADMNSSSSRTAVIAGFNSGTVKRCYGTGNITNYVTNEIGGIVAYNAGGTVENVYSHVNISHNSNYEIGGLTGVNTGSATLKNGYATGDIVGNQNFNVAGLIGDERGGDVGDIYLDVTASNRNTNTGTELTTSEMTGSSAETNMAGLNFQQTWQTVSGEYPELR